MLPPDRGVWTDLVAWLSPRTLATHVDCSVRLALSDLAAGFGSIACCDFFYFFADFFAETFAETFAEIFSETFAEIFSETFAEPFAETIGAVSA